MNRIIGIKKRIIYNISRPTVTHISKCAAGLIKVLPASSAVDSSGYKCSGRGFTVQ